MTFSLREPRAAWTTGDTFQHPRLCFESFNEMLGSLNRWKQASSAATKPPSATKPPPLTKPWCRKGPGPSSSPSCRRRTQQRSATSTELLSGAVTAGVIILTIIIITITTTMVKSCCHSIGLYLLVILPHSEYVHHVAQAPGSSEFPHASKNFYYFFRSPSANAF